MCAANSATLESLFVEDCSSNMGEVVCQSESFLYKTLYINKTAPVVPNPCDEQERCFVLSEN